MFAAVLEFKYDEGAETYFFMEESVPAIMRQFGKEQDLDCLVRMGRGEEDEAGQKELTKIEDFLKKCRAKKASLEDLKAFAANLIVGSFRCIEASEGAGEAEAMKARFLRDPGAFRRGHYWMRTSLED